MPNAHLINCETLEAFPIGSGQTTIGRSRKCKIIVSDRMASLGHATVSCRTQGNFVIRDLGSANGTFVNGSKVLEAHLVAGDSITIGTATFAFQPVDAASTGDIKEWFRELWDAFLVGYREAQGSSSPSLPAPKDPRHTTLATDANSQPLGGESCPPLIRPVWRLRWNIDHWAALLGILPFLCSFALGAAGINAAWFRVRAKAANRPIPAWPLIVLASLWLAWLVSSGWGVLLAKGALGAGLCYMCLRFYQDNEELWQSCERAVFNKTLLRTATFSGAIAVLLLPGITVGWALHEILERGYSAVEGIPQGKLTDYLDAKWPEAPPPSKWHPKAYINWKFDPWRFLLGKARDGLSKGSVNNVPQMISNAALSTHHLLKLLWWLLIAQASYVAVRLYLYVFARVFVGRGGRVVMQLDSNN